MKLTKSERWARLRFHLQILWEQITDLKPSGEVIGLFVMLGMVTLLFFLPSYAPPFKVTPESFEKVCEKYGYEMENITETQNTRFFSAVVSDTMDDYTITYHACTEEFYARFFASRFRYEASVPGCTERYKYTHEFSRATLYSGKQMSVIYRNGNNVIQVTGPTTDRENLNKLIKKLGIHDKNET